MTREDAWKIFKNTGSVEAYITFAQSKNSVETESADDRKDERDNTQNK